MEWAEPLEMEMLEAALKTAAMSLSTSMNLSALVATRSFLVRSNDGIYAFEVT